VRGLLVGETSSVLVAMATTSYDVARAAVGDGAVPAL
jgi:hypothetical protein